MAQLILTILAIALAGAAAYATVYYGSDATQRKQSEISAKALVSHAEQISTALLQFEAAGRRWPNNLDELVAAGHLTGAASWAGSLWELPVPQVPVAHLNAQRRVSVETCLEINRLANTVQGIPARPRTGWRVQCFGGSAQTLVVAAATTASAYELAYPLGGAGPSAAPGEPDPFSAQDWFRSPGAQARVLLDNNASQGDFGILALSASGQQPQATKSVVVRNTGTAPAKIRPALRNAPAVSLASGTCTSASGEITLAAAGSCTLELTWAPQAPALLESAQLSLSGDFDFRPDQSIALYGEAAYFNGPGWVNAPAPPPPPARAPPARIETLNDLNTYAPGQVVPFSGQVVNLDWGNSGAAMSASISLQPSIAGALQLTGVRRQGFQQLGSGTPCASVLPGAMASTPCFTKGRASASAEANVGYAATFTPTAVGLHTLQVNASSSTNALGGVSAPATSWSFHRIHVATQPTTAAWSRTGTFDMRAGVAAGNFVQHVALRDTGGRLPLRVRFELKGTNPELLAFSAAQLGAFRIEQVYPGTSSNVVLAQNGLSLHSCEPSRTVNALASASTCSATWFDAGVSVRIRYIPQHIFRCVDLHAVDERGATMPAPLRICG